MQSDVYRQHVEEAPAPEITSCAGSTGERCAEACRQIRLSRRRHLFEFLA